MDVMNEVRTIIAKTLKLPPDTLSPQTRLADIGAASLDVIEIVFDLEEKFDISIPLAAGEILPGQRGNGNEGELPFETIAELAGAVQKLIDAKRGQ
jgi:acyl carrier protein